MDRLLLYGGREREREGNANIEHRTLNSQHRSREERNSEQKRTKVRKGELCDLCELTVRNLSREYHTIEFRIFTMSTEDKGTGDVTKIARAEY